MNGYNLKRTLVKKNIFETVIEICGMTLGKKGREGRLTGGTK